MTSWHIEQQDGKPYYMPQCEVCGLRYDEYGLYADKEQAATDAVDDTAGVCFGAFGHLKQRGDFEKLFYA